MQVQPNPQLTRKYPALDGIAIPRNILKYLAKPVFKAFGGAMNER